jgi:hypothetical protein
LPCRLRNTAASLRAHDDPPHVEVAPRGPGEELAIDPRGLVADVFEKVANVRVHRTACRRGRTRGKKSRAARTLDGDREEARRPPLVEKIVVRRQLVAAKACLNHRGLKLSSRSVHTRGRWARMHTVEEGDMSPSSLTTLVTSILLSACSRGRQPLRGALDADPAVRRERRYASPPISRLFIGVR